MLAGPAEDEVGGQTHRLATGVLGPSRRQGSRWAMLISLSAILCYSLSFLLFPVIPVIFCHFLPLLSSPAIVCHSLSFPAIVCYSLSFFVVYFPFCDVCIIVLQPTPTLIDPTLIPPLLSPLSVPSLSPLCPSLPPLGVFAPRGLCMALSGLQGVDARQPNGRALIEGVAVLMEKSEASRGGIATSFIFVR